jgi:hypothetical protein
VILGTIGVDHPHASAHLQAFEAAPEIERLLIWDADPTPPETPLENIDAMFEHTRTFGRECLGG